MANDKIKPYRVLSIDGGGMRGLYTTALLNTLSSRFGHNLDVGKGFDLIVGTSTGGLVAAGLASGIPLSKIIDIYKEKGAEIFHTTMPNKGFKKIIWALRHLFNSANQNETLKDILNTVFKNESLGELYFRRKIGICITAVNIANHKLRVFKTPHNHLKQADNTRTIGEICLASSAAPIFLPIAEISNDIPGAKSYFVDGGLCANNPVLIGLIEALQLSDITQPIEIVSIGTCPPAYGEAIDSNNVNKGLLFWNFGAKAVELAMNSQATAYESVAEHLAQNFIQYGKQISFLRLVQTTPSPTQSEYLSLDNKSSKSRSTLIQLANNDALQIYGQAIAGKDNYGMLVPIFQSMPTLVEEE
ncbi:TPA: patatin-like phospholipase family protein [Legionella pneumophila]|nr:patatin-like phospholipase family protein [Legionella pneumophila]